MTINGSGTITGLTAGGLPSATVTQATLATPVASTGPAFRATTSGNTGCALNTWTKIQFNTKTFDTNNNYDNTTNYRFTPTVAGYYQVNGSIGFPSYTATYVNLVIYKNGSVYSGYGSGYNSSAGMVSFTTTDLVYLNGSTDYIEIYVVQGTSGTLNASGGVFSASMVRSA